MAHVPTSFIELSFYGETEFELRSLIP